MTSRAPWFGALVGVAAVIVISAAFFPFRDHTANVTVALVLTAPVVGAAMLSGRRAAVITALVATAAMDLAFIPPVGTLRVALERDVVTLVVFVVVALATGALVARESSRRRDAVARAEETARMHAELQRTVAERDRLELETRRLAVLEEVDRQRAALLRAVSHDLRTPLGTILTVATDLRSGTDYPAATRGELLDLVVREAERLDRIVTNLLSLGRIEAGAFQPDTHVVDLADVAEAVSTRLTTLFRDRSLVVKVPHDLPPVMADFTQVDLVLTNLLENAARHAPSGSVVTLAAHADADDVIVEVTDAGPGIAPALRDGLFEPFFSGGDSTGIGLAICRAIVEAHGGTIRAGDTDGAGARFVFSLPIAD